MNALLKHWMSGQGECVSGSLLTLPVGFEVTAHGNGSSPAAHFAEGLE